MRVKYFPDADTALMEFTDNEVAETREISENICADLDRRGNLVSMTIEHARTSAGVLVSGSRGANVAAQPNKAIETAAKGARGSSPRRWAARGSHQDPEERGG